jgi:glycosyltransferase involved in cell wall biosynthesis
MKLEACIIVKNESAMIESCLKSLRGIDLITVVDTGSRDETVFLAKKYTKNVHHYVWSDDFSAARNYALSKCTGDWILIIDADERLDTPIDEVKRLCSRAGHMVLCAKVKTKDEQLWSTRLFKRRKEIYYKYPVHNVLTYEGDEERLLKMATCLPIEITSGYSPAHNLDPDRSLRILKKEFVKHPEDTRVIYYLGREMLTREMLAEVVILYEKYVELTYAKKWSAELADVLYILAVCKSLNKDFIGAVDNALRSIAVLPTYQAPYLLLAAAYQDQMPDKAKHWAKLAELADDSGVMVKRN